MRDLGKTWNMRMHPLYFKSINWKKTITVKTYPRDNQAPCTGAFSTYSPHKISTKLMSREDT